MKFISLFIATFLFISINAQNTFEKTYNNSASSFPNARCAIELNDSCYLLATDDGLIKTDTSGNILYSMNGFYLLDQVQGHNFSQAIVELDNGNILMAGRGWVIVDQNLNTVNLYPGWEIDLQNGIYQGTNYVSVAKKLNGEIVMTGYSDLNNDGVPYINVTTLNPNGTLLRHQEFINNYILYNPPFFPTQLIDMHSTSIISTSDGGSLFVGASNTHSNGIYGNDALVIKLDSNENIDWQQYYGEISTVLPEEPTDVIELAAGGYMICGNFSDGTAGLTNAGLMRIDANGNLLWANVYALPTIGTQLNETWANSLVQKSNTEILLVGIARDNNVAPQIDEAFMANIDAFTGVVLDVNTFPNWFTPQTIERLNGSNGFLVTADPLVPHPEPSTLIKTDLNGRTGCQLPYNLDVLPAPMVTHLSEYSNYQVGNVISFSSTPFQGASVSTRCCLITADITGDTILCGGQSGSLTATPTSGTGPFNFTWFPGGQTGSTINITGAGTYIVHITDSSGCMVTDSVQVVNGTNPQIPQIVGEVIACNNGTYTIANCQPGVTYSWAVTTGTPSATTGCSVNINWTAPTVGGSIVVTATDTAGCFSTTQLIVYECCEPASGQSYVNVYIDTLPDSPFLTNNPTNVYLSTFGSGSEVGINGTMTVNKDMVIDDANVVLGPNAKIIVLNGFSLTIESGSFLRACSDKLWDAIEVEPNGQLIITDSRIEDAINAVRSLDGGQYTIENTRFRNNHTGIYIGAHNGIHPGYVANSTFTSSGFLLSPFAGQRAKYGIVAEQVGNASTGYVQIGDPSSGANRFRFLDNGIRSINSSIRVYNNRFNSIQPVPLTASIDPISAIWLEGSSKLFISNSIIGGFATNEKNYINSCNEGIVAEGDMNISIIDNRITLTDKTGINIRNVGSLLTTTSILIDDNDILLGAVGINVFNSVIPSTLIQRNRIIAMNSGLQTAIQCLVPFNSPFIPTGTTVSNNNIRNVGTGIKFIRYRKAFITDNNVRDLVNTDPSAPNYGIVTSACQNITVRSNTIRQVIANNTNTFGISVQLSENILTTCNTTNKTEVGIQVAGPSVGTKILQNNFRNNNTGFFLSGAGFIDYQFRGVAPNYLPSDNKWVGILGLKTEVDPTSNILNDINFYARNNGNYWVLPFENGGARPINFVAVNGPRDFCVSVLPLSTAKPKEIALGNIGSNPNEIAIAENTLFNYLQEDFTLLNDQDYSQFHGNCVSSDYGTLYQANSLIADSSTQGLSAASASCQSVIGSNDPMLNWKEVTIIGLSQEINNGQLSNQELATLRTIAWKCPYTDGAAVFQARAMLSEYDTVQYYNSCESNYSMNSVSRLAQKGSTTGNSDITESNVSVFPNPVIEFLNVESTEEIISIRLFDVAGKEKNVNFKNNMIDLAELKSGLYLVRITTVSGISIHKILKE